MTDRIDLATRSLEAETQTEFDRRVDDQATRLTEALRAGRLDNPSFGLGIELEAYVVDDSNRLARVPDAVFEAPCERELGRHNVELHTDPDAFDEDGIDAQATALRRDYRRVQTAAEQAGAELVLDAMWTTPPAEGSHEYLGDIREHDGLALAKNMTASPRYYAIDNDILEQSGREITLSVPGATCQFPSLLFESLTSSIQPHVQVPDAEVFPRYYNIAIRTLGPVLALATNSPLLPPDLYDLERTGDDWSDAANDSDESGESTTIDDPLRLLEETHHELRIPVFEQSINHAWEKVRFPSDIQHAAETIEKLVADQTCAPFLREWLADDDRETLPEQFWELDHKRGTYWRWLRAVIGGQPVDDGDRWSIRIEYRPLPTQPTIDENVGLQCLVAGLLYGLVAADHPLERLERDAAERSFYAAVENGLEADLEWITADGERTTDRTVIYDELFALARRGLREQGVSEETIGTYLAPLEARVPEQMTPSRWKLGRVRDHLEAGSPFIEAVCEMQDEYVRRSGTGEPVIEWD